MVASEIYVSSVFVAGVLSFFAPCIIPLLPVYFSVFFKNSEPGQKVVHLGVIQFRPAALTRTILYILGLSTAFILLGFGAGILGSFINNTWFIRILGGIVIFLGLHQMGSIRFSFLERERKLTMGSSSDGYFGTYLLGLTFSFGWTPCIGPILGAVLGISASSGQAFYGAWLMAVYSIGLSIPFLVLALFSDTLMTRIKRVNKYLGKIQFIGGVVIVLMGILLMTDQLNQLTVFFERML